MHYNSVLQSCTVCCTALYCNTLYYITQLYCVLYFTVLYYTTCTVHYSCALHSCISEERPGKLYNWPPVSTEPANHHQTCQCGHFSCSSSSSTNHNIGWWVWLVGWLVGPSYWLFTKKISSLLILPLSSSSKTNLMPCIKS